MPNLKNVEVFSLHPNIYFRTFFYFRTIHYFVCIDNSERFGYNVFRYG